MATQVHVPVEEYLRTSYDDRPAPDYLDGEIRERGTPTPGHSWAQGNLIVFFGQHRASHKVFAYPELHLRLSPTRYRVADIAVFVGHRPENASHETPQIVVEVLSPDDRMSYVYDKFDDYTSWGIEHIWLADPQARRLQVYQNGDLRRVDSWQIPGSDARIGPDELF